MKFVPFQQPDQQTLRLDCGFMQHAQSIDAMYTTFMSHFRTETAFIMHADRRDKNLHISASHVALNFL
jgi:hypothetical protein